MDSASELWPHRAIVPVQPEIHERWLEQNMGPMFGRWYVSRYGIRTSTYHFRDDKDAVWFTLRWS